jgi:hypothetical protein
MRKAMAAAVVVAMVAGSLQRWRTRTLWLAIAAVAGLEKLITRQIEPE